MNHQQILASYGSGAGTSSYILTGTGGNYYTSADGTTWTARTQGSIDFDWVKNVNSRWFMFAYPNFYTSTNGVIWTSLTYSGTTVRDIGWNGTYYVISDNSAIYYSSNLATWFTATTSIGFQNVAWNGTTFVGVNGLSDGSNNYCYSTNGISWTAALLLQNPIGQPVEPNYVVASSTYFIIGGRDPNGGGFPMLQYSSTGTGSWGIYYPWSQLGTTPNISVNGVAVTNNAYYISTLPTNSTFYDAYAQPGNNWGSTAYLSNGYTNLIGLKNSSKFFASKASTLYSTVGNPKASLSWSSVYTASTTITGIASNL